jgi:hypothetical protein
MGLNLLVPVQELLLLLAINTNLTWHHMAGTLPVARQVQTILIPLAAGLEMCHTFLDFYTGQNN